MRRYWLAFLLLFAVSAVAQSNEIALTIGAYAPRHVNTRSATVFAIEGNVAHRIVHLPKASLYLEVPIAAGLSSSVSALTILGGQSFSTRNYSVLFIAPGARLKLLPGSRLSPYFAIGGGLAHFRRSGGESSTNTGVLDFGGGIDFKLNRFLALRGEVRDFYSGPPQLITGLLAREHQILATGGIVVRF